MRGSIRGSGSGEGGFAMTVLAQDPPPPQPFVILGVVVAVAPGIAGLRAKWIAPYSPTANDFAAMTEPPSAAHWLGTDQFGRDLLSRIIYAARTARITGF